MPVDYPGWAQVAVFAGMFSVLLYIAHLLVTAPEISGRELSEGRRKVLTTIATTVLVVMALTGGVGWLGEYFGVGFLYSEAVSLVERHLSYSTTAFSILSVAHFTLQFLSFLPFVGQVTSKALLYPANNMVSIIESVALHKILLEFGHQYAMATLFPFGLVLMLLPPLRGAGALLVAHAVALWLALPAVMVGLYLPMEALLGADESPVSALQPLAELTPAQVANASDLEPTDVSGILGFMDWYRDEVAMWLYLPVLGVILVEAAALSLFMMLASGSALMFFRRAARLLIPVRLPR